MWPFPENWVTLFVLWIIELKYSKTVFFFNNNKKYAGWKQIKQVTKVYTNDIYVVEKPNKITPMHTSSNDKNKQAEQQAQSTNKLCKHKNLIK